MEEQDQLEEKPFYKSWPFWFVFFYLLFVIIYTIVFKNSSGENVLLASNELGDFLAGVFAPLAFLFLYLGYKQQGKELKNQSKELEASVKQQTQLVLTAKEELKLTIAQHEQMNKKQLIQAQPYFHIADIKVKVTKLNEIIDINISFKIKNSRTMCRSLFFLLSLDDESPSILPNNSTSFDLFDINTTNFEPAYVQASIKGEFIEDFDSKLFLQFCYTDAFDNLQVKIFQINLLREDSITYSFDSYVSQSQIFY